MKESSNLGRLIRIEGAQKDSNPAEGLKSLKKSQNKPNRRYRSRCLAYNSTSTFLGRLFQLRVRLERLTYFSGCSFATIPSALVWYSSSKLEFQNEFCSHTSDGFRGRFNVGKYRVRRWRPGSW